MNRQNVKYNDTPERINREFSAFVSRNEATVSGKSLASFAFSLDKINLISVLNAVDEHYSDFLFYEKFEDNFSFIAINELIRLKFNGKLNSLSHTVSELNDELVHNWGDYNLHNPPFITGAIKFDSCRTSFEWQNFDSYHFFVPKILLLQKETNFYLIYNFFLPEEDKISTLLNEFNKFISSLFNNKFITDKNKKYVLEKNGSVKEEKKYWYDLVKKTAKKLDVNFKKVVLSRRIDLELKGKIDWDLCFKHLEDEFPKCYLFMLKSGDAIFFGASPENFISIQNNKIEIDAIAGSASVESKNAETELMTSKNIKEHKYVIDFITESLSKFAQNIKIDTIPQIKKLKNVQHLHTKIYAELNSRNDIVNLIEAMFPTPAVCGLPKSNAIKTIRETEDFDRGLFSGLTGWMDLEMNCQFAVAIRSALSFNKRLYLYAGAGIVEDSIPEEEYDETEMKFNTILNLFDEVKTG
ncbi:isochorismate synthase MenF [Bacteroidota bacterium]